LGGEERNPAKHRAQSQLGKIYLAGHDPKLTARTWTEAMAELAGHGQEQSRKRCRRELDSRPFQIIRDKKIVETTGDDLRVVLRAGGAATNNYLHRLHNLAVGLGWLPWPIIPPKLWPRIVAKEKRGICAAEHEAVLSKNSNESNAVQSRGLAFKCDWPFLKTCLLQNDAERSLPE
jgi:hypothetical protein